MFKRTLIPVLTLLLIALAAPAAQAAGCVVWWSGETLTLYVDFGGGDTLKGRIQLYRDANCQTSERHDFEYRPFGVVYASSAEATRALCESINDKPISEISGSGGPIRGCPVDESLGVPHAGFEILERSKTNRDWTLETYLKACKAKHPEANHAEQLAPTYWICARVWGDAARNSGGSGGSRGCGFGIKLPLDGLRLHAFDGMGSGIEFNRLDNCGVGDPAVIDMGFLDAVDIWSNIGSGYEVCFPQPGRIVFLDAATAPRSLIFPDYNHDDGWTCASMGIAGTMVLVNAPAGTVAQTSTAAPARRPGTDDSIDDAIELEDCTVTPRVNLRLREAPWGTILDVIPRDIEVPAMARTENWFNVTYDEIDGWSAAWLADSDGDCDWTE